MSGSSYRTWPAETMLLRPHRLIAQSLLLPGEAERDTAGSSYRPCSLERCPERSGALVPRGEVVGLLLRELVDLDAHRLELETGDLLVDLRRHGVDLAVELARVLRRVLEREGLVREGHVHHERRVTLGGGEVDEPAVRDEIETPPVGERELLDELPRAPRL